LIPGRASLCGNLGQVIRTNLPLLHKLIRRGAGHAGPRHAPNRRLSGFFLRENWLCWDVVTLFSLPEVFRGPHAKNALAAVARSAPDPAGEAYDAPPDPLVGWGGGHPSPILTPLGASILAPWALSFCGPQCKILATPLLCYQAV